MAGLDRPGEYAARYAEEILFADRWIGEVVEAMRARTPGQAPVILLTSDHGESMGEQGWFFQHGQSATPDLARVPFIIVAPELEARREAAWVSHVDVAPTLLELAGAGGLEESSGVSLASLLRGDDELEARVLYCDTEGEAAAYTPEGVVRALGGAAFAVPSPGNASLQIIGMHEKAPGVWRPKEASAETVEALTRYLGDAAPLVAADAMAPEHVEQLRALGYLDPEPGPSGQSPADGPGVEGEAPRSGVQPEKGH